MWYKLKRIMMRPNGVEKQVRPDTWWKPWSNTIAYLKLEQNTNDSSWKWNNGTGTNITYTTLSTWKKVATLNWSSRVDFSSSLFSSWSFTTSMWIYWNGLTSSSGALYVIMGNAANDSQWLIEDYHNYSGWYLRTSMNRGAGVHTRYGYSDRTWFLYTVTYNGSSVSTYKNGSLLGTASASFGWVRNFYLWYRVYNNDRYWIWYFSDFICENKARTAQEVTDYYNLTKANYWL